MRGQATARPHPPFSCVMRAAVIAALAGCAVAVTGAAHAQADYPNKPVKVIVGFAPGGPTDILGRVIGNGMSKVTSQQFYVENRTGAGGNIATEQAARAEPDGYTLQLSLMSSAVNET